MAKIYDVIQQHTLPDLVEIVNRYLEKGWEVQGGMQVTGNNFGNFAYFQAVVKTAPPDMRVFKDAERE